MRNCAKLMVVLINIFLLSGCTFAVKDTSGIKQFIGDQTEVERVALKLKERFGDPESDEYKKSVKYYSEAALASDKYIRQVKLDAEVKREINESEKSYKESQSGVQPAFKGFIEEGKDMLGMSATGLELGAESAAFVVGVLEGVIKLNHAETEAAIKRLNSTMDQSFMLEFSALSREVLLNKYRGK